MINTREQIDIALCFNDAYLKHIGPLVYSLSKHNTDVDFLIHVVYKNLSQDSLDHLETIATFFPNVTFDFRYITSDLINQVAVDHTHFPIETYFRLILADVLHDVDRLLYLDVDLLISGSVKPLWDMDLTGSCIAAAPEKDIYIYYQWYLDQLGFTEQDTYFSAGVLLFDLKNMRERQLPERLLHEAIEKGESLRFCDQDLLNLYFRDEVVYFDETYNYSSWLMANGDKGLDDLAIQHFNGNLKPWMPIMSCPEGQRRFVAQYHAYRRDFFSLLRQDQKKLTILVDARQASDFLYPCLESITSQSYQLLDILLVTTPDDVESIKAIDTFQAYDQRIKKLVVTNTHETCLGLVHTQLPASDYLYLIQGADFLEADALDKLVKTAQDQQADIVAADFYILDVSRGSFIIETPSTGDIIHWQQTELVTQPLNRQKNTLFGKLIKRELIDQVSSVAFGHTELALRQLYAASQSIIALNSHLFCHRTHLTNSTQVLDPSFYDNKLRAFAQLLTQQTLLNQETDTTCEALQSLLAAMNQLPQSTLNALSRDSRYQLSLFNSTTHEGDNT